MDRQERTSLSSDSSHEEGKSPAETVSIGAKSTLSSAKGLGCMKIGSLCQQYDALTGTETLQDSLGSVIAKYEGKRNTSPCHNVSSSEQANNDSPSTRQNDDVRVSCKATGKRKSSGTVDQMELKAQCRRRIVELTAPVVHHVKKKSSSKFVDHTYRDLSQVFLKNYKPATSIDEDDTSDRYFVPKLHKILSDPAYERILKWQPHGRAFRIHDAKMLEVQVCAKHFGHSRYSSFLRQLNNASFKYITKGEDFGCYYHQAFLRGMPHLAEYMPIPSRSRRKLNPDPENEPDLYRISELFPLPKSHTEEKKMPSQDIPRSSEREYVSGDASGVRAEKHQFTNVVNVSDILHAQEHKNLFASSLVPSIPLSKIENKPPSNGIVLPGRLQTVDSKNIGAIGSIRSRTTNVPTVIDAMSAQKQKLLLEPSAGLMSSNANITTCLLNTHTNMMNAPASGLFHPTYVGNGSLAHSLNRPVWTDDVSLGVSVPTTLLAQQILQRANPTLLAQNFADISSRPVQSARSFSQQDRHFNTGPK